MDAEVDVDEEWGVADMATRSALRSSAGEEGGVGEGGVERGVGLLFRVWPIRRRN